MDRSEAEAALDGGRDWRAEAKGRLREIVDRCYGALPTGHSTPDEVAAKLEEIARLAMSAAYEARQER